jgi:hypothetical protein
MTVNSPLCAFVIDGLPADEVNNALELILYANGHLDCCSGHTELGTDLVDNAPWVRAGSKREKNQKGFKISKKSRRTYPSCL